MTKPIPPNRADAKGGSGPACPNCGSTTDGVVLDTRPSEGTIRRRRACVACAQRFTTYEYPAIQAKLDGPELKAAINAADSAADALDHFRSILTELVGHGT